jgi:bifunctional non-homologous end joining protein LigD
VIDYYARVAEAILPHLRGRPLTLHRFPNGVEASSFYEKRCPEHRPDWVRTARVTANRAGEIDFCLCENLSTLIWLAQLAALELHPSLARASDPDRPTVVAFDLDPGPPASLIDCCRVALRLRELFEELGLESFPKTSGSKGLQVYLPLNRRVGYERTGAFAHAVAKLLESRYPDEVVSRMTKSLRRGKVLVDWSQNNRHKTTIAVYSLRARERDDPGSITFEAAEVLDRVEREGDLFEPVLKLRQALPELSEGG